MKKILSYLRWGTSMILNLIPYGLITILFLLVQLITWNFYGLIPNLLSLIFTGWIMFPILYHFRKWIRNIKPFWYYFDDEDEFGFDLPWFRPDMKNGFIKAWLWAALRNPMWNLQTTLGPKQGEKKLIEVVKLELKQNDKIVVDPYIFATIKYVDSNGKNPGNQGEYLSKEHSILGEVFCWYEIDGTLYFRKSKTYEKNNRWYVIQFGTNDDRHLFNRKYSKKNLNWL